MENFYELLKIRPDASQDEIKIAFIKLVSRYHPDVYNGDKKYAESVTAQLTEAYSILKDPYKRRDYDLMLELDNKKIKTNYSNDFEVKRTSSGQNYDQKMSQRYFKNSQMKKQKDNIFKRLFKSKLFYCLIFVFAIELIIIFLFLKN